MSDITQEQIDQLANAIRAIAHGPTSGPAGLEALSMALTTGGLSGRDSLADVFSVGQAEMAEAIREGLSEIANAIRSTREAR